MKEKTKWFLSVLISRAGKGFAFIRNMWKMYKKYDEVHAGTIWTLRGGAWVDKDSNLYNCTGKCVGKIEWNDGFGTTYKGRLVKPFSED